MPRPPYGPGSPKMHDYLANNVASVTFRESGDIKGAFEGADEVIRVSLLNQRVAVLPMEPRAIIANYDAGNGQLVIYAATRAPWMIGTTWVGCSGYQDPA